MCFVKKGNIERNNQGNVEGTNFEHLCLMFVCKLVFCFFVCIWIDFVDWTRVKGLHIYEKGFEMCIAYDRV